MTIRNGIEHKFVDLKALRMSDDGPGEISGYRSVYGEIDESGDIVIKGAFADCIPEYLHSGFTAHSHDWNFSEAVGFPISAEEDDYGWKVTSQFHGTPDAQNIRQKARERMDAGKQVGFSFGYKADEFQFIEQKDFKTSLAAFIKADRLAENLAKAQKFSRIRILKKVSAIEDSLVTAPMNKLAAATAVKSEGADDPVVMTKEEKIEVKKAIGASGLPLAGRDVAWDASAADKAVRKWADAEDSPNAKYAKAFFFVADDGGDKFGDYKLGFADIVDGKLTAIPKGIFAVAGGHGVDAADIPDADKAAIKTKVSAYYKKIAKAEGDDTIVAPWDKEAKADATECVCCADDSLDCGCASKDGSTCSCHADCQNCVDNDCEGLVATPAKSALEERLERLESELATLKAESKVGATNSVADIKKIKSIHDTAVSMEPSMCPDYPVEGKTGARNSASMKKHLTTIHDATAVMEKSACPSQEKALKIREQAIDLYHKALMGVMGVKGIYEDALAELTAASPYQILYAFLNTVQQIDDLEDASEGSAFTPDTEALVREAAMAAMNDFVTWALAKLAEDMDDYPYPYSYYASPPTSFKELSSGLVTEPFAVHQLAMVTAVNEIAQRSGVIQKAIGVFLDRAKEKQEFRAVDEGRKDKQRALSPPARVQKNEIDQGLQNARDHLIAAVEKAESVPFLEPEDLSVEMEKLKLQTERLRTNSLARNAA